MGKRKAWVVGRACDRRSAIGKRPYQELVWTDFAPEMYVYNSRTEAKTARLLIAQNQSKYDIPGKLKIRKLVLR